MEFYHNAATIAALGLIKLDAAHYLNNIVKSVALS